MRPADPTDEQVEAIVNDVSQEQRARILELLGELESMDEVMVWRGGEVVDHTADGSPVRQMPWAESSEQLSELRRLLYDCKLIVPFDWSAWGQQSGFSRGRSLDELSVADAVRMITGLVRSDRFVEGALGASIKDGTLPTAIRRALAA